jgi:hypothetical protein
MNGTLRFPTPSEPVRKYTHRGVEVLGMIYCPDHGWQDMYTLFGRTGRGYHVGSGCQKHYEDLPILAEEEQDKIFSHQRP